MHLSSRAAVRLCKWDHIPSKEAVKGPSFNLWRWGLSCHRNSRTLEIWGAWDILKGKLQTCCWSGLRKRSHVWQVAELEGEDYPRIVEPSLCHQEPEIWKWRCRMQCFSFLVSVCFSLAFPVYTFIPHFWKRNVCYAIGYWKCVTYVSVLYESTFNM